MNIQNLIIRSATGLLFLVVMIAGILWHPYAYLALFTFIVGATLCEYNKLMQSAFGLSIPILLHGITGAAVFIVTVLVRWGLLPEKLILIMGLIAIVYAISSLYSKQRNPFQSILYPFFGYLYILIPFTLSSHLAFPKSGEMTFTPYILLMVFVFIWISDSAAYFFGSLLGRHRLFERISPKKSWEGFVGGLLFAVLSAYIASLFLAQLSMAQWIGLSVVTVIAGTYGDLFESFLKRTIAVKDSGTVLPGHGGLLDRFDAPLFAIPAAVAYLSIIL